MNPGLLRTLLFSFSFEQIFKVIFYTFLAVLSLPLLAVVLITHIGNQTVSDSLTSVNVNTQSIEIKDPRTGKIVSTVSRQLIWPTTGTITLEFGESDLPYQVMHTGIDIASHKGDPIRAFMSGRVIYSGEINWGYGKHIIIDHGNNVTSLYGHLDSLDVVQSQEVIAGQIIGKEGSTGWSTGPHLHFEVRVYGVPVNPRIFL